MTIGALERHAGRSFGVYPNGRSRGKACYHPIRFFCLFNPARVETSPSVSATSTTLSLHRDTRVIGLVGTGHGFSHFYQLALPPLFPLMHLEEGWSYTQLGVLVAVLYTVSGVLQPVAGFVVDRVGPRLILYFGLGLCATATGFFSIATSYPLMVVLVALVGVGNSVFHPCGFTILSHNVSEHRVGRGFGVHAIGGYAGYAAAPVSMIWLATYLGWREALLLAGLLGVAFLVILISAGHPLLKSTDAAQVPAVDNQSASTLLLTPVVVACFFFFCLIAMAQIGLQTFAPSALLDLFQTPVTISNSGLTTFLLGTAGGVLVGGVIADRTKHHHTVAALCLIPPALLSALPGFVDFGVVGLWSILTLIGFSYGLLIPSRDMVVRSVAPRHASGRIFGVVYSGLDVGGAFTPVVFGWFLDHGYAAATFVCVALCFATASALILVSRRLGESTYPPGAARE